MSNTSHSTTVFVDGIEGDSARVVVDGKVHHIDRALLPSGTREGAWLQISVTSTKAPPSNAEKLREAATRDDDGGDIKL